MLKKKIFLSKCLFTFLLQYFVQKYCVWRGPKDKNKKKDNITNFKNVYFISI